MADRGDDVTSALLFDLDGTLVDSDADHLVAFQTVFAPFGVRLDRARYTREIMGASNTMIGERFLGHLPEAQREQVLDAKEVAYRDSLGALTATRGAAELLDHAQAHGLPCALVTNAPRANADRVLEAIGLSRRLPIRVIGGELARAKPDPLPYLTGLERTGARADKSVAFEDSLSGVRAAAAAGIAVVGLTTGLPGERLIEAGAVFAVADFTDRRIYDLIERRRQE
ncbi:MAG: HAD-IA family hydrolase [Pseudomonadota bacterium]|nr:HAD-IA family hydrolase [Pseudomonadota bacterium]